MSEGIQSATGTAAGAPWWVTIFTPITRSLLGNRIPMGFNGLITIRGRKSGLPRTTPIAIIQVSGRRWVWSPWGEVNWVRNLRAAGRATLTKRGRKEEVRATELNPAERVHFFRDVLGPYARAIPGGMTFVRLLDQTDLNDPVEVAQDRRVFELHPVR